MRMLVVDDNAQILDLIQEALGGRPIDVLRASSAQEALTLWHGSRPVDAVLLDVNLGQSNGLDLGKTFLAEGLAPGRIGVMTDLPTTLPETVQMLPKPFSLQDLWDLVDHWQALS